MLQCSTLQRGVVLCALPVTYHTLVHKIKACLKKRKKVNPLHFILMFWKKTKTKYYILHQINCISQKINKPASCSGDEHVELNHNHNQSLCQSGGIIDSVCFALHGKKKELRVWCVTPNCNSYKRNQTARSVVMFTAGVQLCRRAALWQPCP